jgi:hypothetical protein
VDGLFDPEPIGRVTRDATPQQSIQRNAGEAARFFVVKDDGRIAV